MKFCHITSISSAEPPSAPFQPIGDANYKNRTLTLALLRNWVSSASF